jgi:hypothetical protein
MTIASRISPRSSVPRMFNRRMNETDRGGRAAEAMALG